ncbi:putative RDD family membrane protein YckC [Virgibacillus natechei]|uniref:RDD family membrane protein YckC n=1 Tax=Virgibacillus natechei TaxID=1216297 RepID=A0ABS4IGN7_9BACI|nr:RDD family protein [Virgibacillus natechei]MBP1970107.1 putative RDD family membrane protein YckC [Virgibacillus natechei]UZD14186.1 RDD family protein [Virgibacillus natechei]
MNEEHEYKIADEASLQRRYAGFWMRFWAYLVDLIIVFSINGILLSPFKFINNGAPVDIGFWTLTGVIGSAVFYLYFLLMTRFLGQTIGKMLFGLRVVREDAEPLKWSDLLFRELVGRFLHRVFFFAAIIYVVVAFTPEKQGVHDMIGNTRVVFE